MNPGTYGNVSVGLPGFVGSSGLFGYLIGFVGCPGIFGIHDPIGLYVTTSLISSESPVTFTNATLALSAKNPLTTGDLTSAKSLASDQSPYLTSLVTKLTLAVRVNLASCVTVFGVSLSPKTGVLSSYTYEIVRVTVLFRFFSSNPAGYLGPFGLSGFTGVPSDFGFLGSTVTSLAFSTTLNS